MKKRPLLAGPSSNVPPVKIVRGDSQEGNKKGPPKNQPLEQFSSSAKANLQAEPKPENKARNLDIPVKKTKTKLSDAKRKPSNIFKSFSHSRLKPSREDSSNSDQVTSEVECADSVRTQSIIGHLHKLTMPAWRLYF